MANFISDLAAPLVDLNGQDTITLGNAFEGIHVFGSPGSGKTSGSGQTIARSFLRAGMGGLVLCSKPSEVERWQKYAAENGRESSLFIFDKHEGFNFVEYALARYGVDAITNVVGILMRTLDDARKARGKTGSDENPFWDESTEEVLKHAIPVLYSATGTVTIDDIIDFAIAAPATPERVTELAKNTRAFKANAAMSALMKMDSPEAAIALSPAEGKRLLKFWASEWQSNDGKTRSNILSSLRSRLGLFRHGVLKDCFTTKTTWIPETLFHGCITIVGLPVQANETEGRLAQLLMKYMTQLAIESRKTLPERHQERPVFLWVDEAHRFVSMKDEQFLAECRENRACCCFLSQGLPSYYSALGRDQEKTVDGLIGKFKTQVFHQNGCHHTNEFASKIIGRGIQQRRTVGTSYSVNHGVTKGVSVGKTRGFSKGFSIGKSEGESTGINQSFNRGRSVSRGTNRGRNIGGGESVSSGKSGGSSHGYTSSNGGTQGSGSSSTNSGWNNSKSRNSSWSQSTGSSETEGHNSGWSAGRNSGRNSGRNQSFNTGVNESETVTESFSETTGETFGENESFAEQMDNLIEPNYFANELLTGGAHRIVTGLVFSTGARFSNGKNHILVGFKQ
jgi:hypothetical protein